MRDLIHPWLQFWITQNGIMNTADPESAQDAGKESFKYTLDISVQAKFKLTAVNKTAVKATHLEQLLSYNICTFSQM